MASLKLIFVLAVTIFERSLAQTGLCPAPNGDFPNPSSELCTTFFRCFQGNPALLRCPSNQRFDFLFRTCRQQGLVDCNSQLEVFATPAITSGIGALGSQLAPLVGAGSLEPLRNLGAGFQNGDLLNLLSQLDGNNEGGQNADNGLANLLIMSALLNQRSSTDQQESTLGTVPLSQIYPIYNQPPLDSLIAPREQVTNQNYQMPRNIYDSDDTGLEPDTGPVLPEGKTFIFIPQSVQGYIGQPQGQGHVQPSWSPTDPDTQGHNVGVVHDANQNYNAVQSISTPQVHNVGRPHGAFQGQNTVNGQHVDVFHGSNQGQNVDKSQVSNQGQISIDGQNVNAIQGVKEGQNTFQGQNLGDILGINQGRSSIGDQMVGVLQGSHEGQNTQGQNIGVIHDVNQGQNVDVFGGINPGTNIHEGQNMGVVQGLNQGQSALPGQNVGVLQGTIRGQNAVQGQESQDSQGPTQGQNGHRPFNQNFQGRVGLRGRRRGFRNRQLFAPQNMLTQLPGADSANAGTTVSSIGLADLGRK